MREVELRSGTRGRFEVTLDGEQVFSKAGLGRHPRPGEVFRMFEAKLGPALSWRQPSG